MDIRGEKANDQRLDRVVVRLYNVRIIRMYTSTLRVLSRIITKTLPKTHEKNTKQSLVEQCNPSNQLPANATFVNRLYTGTYSCKCELANPDLNQFKCLLGCVHLVRWPSACSHNKIFMFNYRSYHEIASTHTISHSEKTPKARFIILLGRGRHFANLNSHFFFLLIN